MTEVFERTHNALALSQPTLPAEWYRSEAHHARELDAIWRRHWLYLGRGDGWQPLDVTRHEIAGQSIIVLRDEQGAMRAFYNTCRHRGSRLCTEAAGRLERRRITCPYHQWSYALDGRLLSTGRGRGAAGFDRADWPLYPVAIAEHRGFVFVNLAGEEAGPFEEAFGEEMAPLANWPLEALAVGHRFTKTLRCNWKVFWENFNECLHCPNIHPELVELVPIYGRRISYFRDEPGWVEHADDPDPRYRGGLRAGAETWSDSGRLAGEAFAGLTPEERQRGQSYFVSLPSLFIAAHADYMRTVRVLPLGPEETELEVEWLFAPATLARDDLDLDGVYAFGERVLLQDAEASELNQRGLHARGFAHGVLMPEEYHVKAFHDWLRMQIGEPD